VSDCCLTPNEQLFSHMIARTSYIRLDDDDIVLIQDQRACVRIEACVRIKRVKTDSYLTYGHSRKT
jgi:hypothetical protein